MHDECHVRLGLGCENSGRGEPRIVDQDRVRISLPLDRIRGIGDDRLEGFVITVEGFGESVPVCDVELVVVDVVQEHVDTAQVVGGDVDLLSEESLPDVVLSEDLDKNVVDLASKVGESVIRLFSFELKKEITSDTVREYYFQAVSNSSWANEGYLVAPKITEEALQQLGKLNASFGIGVIRLNLSDIYQSEIVIPSRDNESLDFGMIDDFVRINPDFDEFIKNIHKTLKTDEPVSQHYDEVLDSEEIADYLLKKQIS